MNKEMNKDRIKQLRDALDVIRLECAAHRNCSPDCPLFSIDEDDCGIEPITPSSWDLNLNIENVTNWYAFD